MSLSPAESRKVQQLAQEGKQTKRIFEDHFPHLSYSEIAAEVRDWGEKSSLGRMKMISKRLKEIAATDDAALRSAKVAEVQKLVRKLYDNHKTSHAKLTTIREALEL